MLVRVDGSAVTYSNEMYFDDWLAHFRGAPITGEYLGIKRIADIAHLLQPLGVKTVCASTKRDKSMV